MSKFKEYKAYQQILRVYTPEFAEKMMEDASKCPSFSGNKNHYSTRIVSWKETCYTQQWINVFSKTIGWNGVNYGYPESIQRLSSV